MTHPDMVQVNSPFVSHILIKLIASAMVTRPSLRTGGCGSFEIELLSNEINPS